LHAQRCHSQFDGWKERKNSRDEAQDNRKQNRQRIARAHETQRHARVKIDDHSECEEDSAQDDAEQSTRMCTPVLGKDAARHVALQDPEILEREFILEGFVFHSAGSLSSVRDPWIVFRQALRSAFPAPSICVEASWCEWQNATRARHPARRPDDDRVLRPVSAPRVAQVA
jgi:hypothetical protein